MPASIRLKAGTYTRCEFTAKETHCPLCQGKLRISQHAAHVFWTLKGRLGTISKEKRCLSENCPNPKLRFRPPEPRMLAISHSNLGLDLVFLIGEKRLSQGLTFRSLWQEMNEREIRVTQRTLQNAFHYYMSLFDPERIQCPKLHERLRANQGVVLAADAVSFEEGGPYLCVLVEVLTGEIIAAERVERLSERHLGNFCRRGVAFAQSLGLPILSSSLGDGLFDMDELHQVLPAPSLLERPKYGSTRARTRLHAHPRHEGLGIPAKLLASVN